MSSNVSFFGPRQWKSGCLRCDTSGSMGAQPSQPPASAQPLRTSPSAGGANPAARRSAQRSHFRILSASTACARSRDASWSARGGHDVDIQRSARGGAAANDVERSRPRRGALAATTRRSAERSRGRDADTPRSARGRDVDTPWNDRSDAAATTWIWSARGAAATRTRIFGGGYTDSLRGPRAIAAQPSAQSKSSPCNWSMSRRHFFSQGAGA